MSPKEMEKDDCKVCSEFQTFLFYESWLIQCKLSVDSSTV